MTPLVPVETVVFCDMRLDDCEGSKAPYVCPDETNSCTIATVPPGYAVYKVQDVQHYQAEAGILTLSWTIVMLMTTLIFWFKGKAVPEKNAEGPTHWSAWVVTTMVWINAALIAWSALVSLK